MPNDATNGMMDSSYGNADVTPPNTMPADKAPQESVDEENAGAAEILISKDKLPSGTKEGDECTFKVKKDFGDEYSLEYVKEDKSSDEAPTKENLAATTDKELSALDSQG